MTTFPTLSRLVGQHPKFENNQRPYRVTIPGAATVFVLSNSPGNAALEHVKVEAVGTKEIMAALSEVVAENNHQASTDAPATEGKTD